MKESKLKRTNSRLTRTQKQQNNSEQEIEKDAGWKSTKINVVIQNQAKLGQIPKIIKNMECYLFENGNIVAKHFFHQCRKLNYVGQDTSISYYYHPNKYYVFGVVVPKSGTLISEDLQIQSRFLQHNTLTLKVREKRKISVQQLLEQQKQKFEQAEEDKTSKAQKQKKISEVVEKVGLWRKIYSGFFDECGNYNQKQLDVAATDVGIAKKTLDDYLLQIRNGKKYGFNFNEKSNCRIGELRSFVRDEKKKQSTR